MNVWEERKTISFMDVDPSGFITLFSVFDYFQKAAINHAQALGVGSEALLARGQVWLLSRISVRIERRPRLDETITLKTWPRGAEKLFILRDYEMTLPSGERLVRARSCWLLIDYRRRIPLRPSALEIPLPHNDGLDALSGVPAALETLPEAREEGCRAAVYSDIDYHNHVNNARYIQWIQDAFGNDALQNARKMEFDINYLSEILSGERIRFFTVREIPEQLALEGRKEDGQPAFRARLCVMP